MQRIGSDTSTPSLHFKTAEGQARYLAAYTRNLTHWPVAYASRRLETSFGSTHVLVSGPEGAPPVLLLHGFGFSATMWYPNVGALAEDHRVYAVDVMGDTNQSVPAWGFKRRAEMADWLRETIVPREGGVRFEALPPPTQAEVERLLRVVRHRVLRLLEVSRAGGEAVQPSSGTVGPSGPPSRGAARGVGFWGTVMAWGSNGVLRERRALTRARTPRGGTPRGRFR